MPNYIQIIGDCFPGVQAIVTDGKDPSVYTNLTWISTPIPQAELDASPCAAGLSVDISDNPDYQVYVAGRGVNFYHGLIPFRSGTTKFHDFDTAPLITEGTEIWSIDLTPNSTSSLFTVSFALQIDTNKSTSVVAAVFCNDRLVGASQRYCSGANKPGNMHLQFTDTPNTTEPITYSARIGLLKNNGTWYINRTKSFTLGDSLQQHFVILENE